MLPSSVIELRYYLADDGESPFEAWFEALDAQAGAKVAAAVARLEQGNLSNAKGVGRRCWSIVSIGVAVTGCISAGTARCS